MSARGVIANALFRLEGDAPLDALDVLEALEEEGFTVVQLPEEHFAGDYAVVHVESDEIHIDVSWIDNTDDARAVAAALLRAADQLDKQRAEERGPDGDELDSENDCPCGGCADMWERADDARDAQVDRENGVL